VHCNQSGVDPCNPPPLSLADFIASDFASRRSPSTARTIRAAISEFYKLFDIDLSSSILSRTVGAMNLVAPSQPRYSSYFDVNKVRSHLKSWGPNDQLSLQSLRNKTLLLLKLASLCRGADIPKVPRSQVRFFSDRVELRARFSKEVLLGSDSKVWSEPLVADRDADPDLCPVTCLKLYLEKSQGLNSDPEALFVGHQSPFVLLAPGTINQICQKIMAEAGIDTTVFKGGSTRETGTSTLLNQGVPEWQVQKRGRWASKSVMRKFYAHTSLHQGPGAPGTV
jgi:hypothetical protein